MPNDLIADLEALAKVWRDDAAELRKDERLAGRALAAMRELDAAQMIEVVARHAARVTRNRPPLVLPPLPVDESSGEATRRGCG